VGFGGMVACGGWVVAGLGQLRQHQMGVSPLQDVAAAVGDRQRLGSQPLGLVRRPRRHAQPGQVDEDVGFALHVVDPPAAL